jgi:N-acetylmuramoyl-L-alanine amidase
MLVRMPARTRTPRIRTPRARLVLPLALVAAVASIGAVEPAPSTPPPPPTAPAPPLAGVTVGIDPGHNPGNARHPGRIARLVDAGTLRKACDTAGTAAPGGMSEASLNLRVSRLLRARLQALGAKVILTQDGKRPAWGPCITERARIGNAADVVVSIHADGALARGARGFHVITPARVRGLTDDIAAPSATLAIKVRWHVRRRTGLPLSTYIGERGISVRRDIGGLNWSDVPKVMLEMGNMHSSADMRVLGSRRGQRRMADALAGAVTGFMATRPGD